MSKAVEGAALLAGAVGMGVAAFTDPALIASPAFDKIMASLAIGGISMEAGAIASALTTNRGMTITTRQAAANRQIIYGQQRVGGVLVYESTTGSSHDQVNLVMVLAGHEIESIQNLYLDGRQVFWEGSGDGYSVRNGIGFGGTANSNTYNGPNGQYNFGGTGHSGIYAEARYGDQLPGDVIGALTANDPTWAADGKGNSPWMGGCAYIYLKLENNPTVFPNMPPDIKITVNGKNNIWDPRTQSSGFTSNWALITADIITDPVFGLGDNTVDQLQLIAASNVADEQIAVAALPGQTESQYTCNYHYDASVSPGDALAAIMPGANGGISQIGGQWYIWPDYYQGPSFTFGEQHLTNTFQWKPYRSVRSLVNRVNGTYIAVSSPWNLAGNLWDSNGFYNGILGSETNFPFGFTPTNFPQFAADSTHGYPSDEFLSEDGGIQHPLELSLSSVISVTQAQRIAKLNLMHNRQQGEGKLEMGLASYVMQPKDTFYFNFGPLNWINKLLEVTSVSFQVDEDQASGTQAIRVQYGVRETDPSVYEWTPDAEELTVYDIPASPSQAPLTPAPPTEMTLNSGPSVAQINPDGTVNNLIVVDWNTPLDILAIGIQVQYRLTGTTSWIAAPSQGITLNTSWISNVVPGAVYDVRIASYRANGQVSTWVEQDAYTVINTPTDLGTLAAQLPAITANSQLAGTVPGEMLVNGNFAQGLAPWGAGTISTSEFKNATQSLLLLNNTAGQSVTLAAGRTYMLQMWVMTDGNVVTTNGFGAGGYVGLTAGSIKLLATNTGTHVFSSELLGFFLPATTATPWTLIQMVFSVDTTTAATINVQNSVGGGTVAGNAWFDGVSLTDVTAQSNQLGGVDASLITPITALMPSEAGADVTSNQAIVYTGASGNLVPNGTLILGSVQGYVFDGGTVYTTTIAGTAGSILVGPGGHAFTPSFQVIPGQAYRIQFDGGTFDDGTHLFYHRIFYGSQYAPNIDDEQGVAGYIGLTDFLAGGTMADAATTYTYEWTCPAGAYYASLAVYSLGTSNCYFTRFVAIDYGAAGEWGADVTGTNTSADTATVDGVPSATIAQVVPSGFEVFINSGAREYSIQAI